MAKNKVLELVDLDIQKLKPTIKKQRTNPVLKQTEVMDCLNLLHKKCITTPIDKASNNVSVICKRYYAEVVLKEIGILGNGSELKLKKRLKKFYLSDFSIVFFR